MEKEIFNQLSLFDDTAGALELRRVSAGKKKTATYEDFIDKFKSPKTTDDCYTPEKVYAAVLDFVQQHAKIEGKEVVRPFYPGGDFERFEYPENCVVIDNPPFSIMAKILRFYSLHKVPFFLFAPALTLFSAPELDLTYIIAGASITYANGAVVATSFISNLFPDLKLWVCPEIVNILKKAQADQAKSLKGFIYPDNLVTAATLQKLAHHNTSLKVRKASCFYVKDAAAAKAAGRSLFGGGYLLSTSAAAERAAAERAAATPILLSDAERSIIATLDAAE